MANLGLTVFNSFDYLRHKGTNMKRPTESDYTSLTAYTRALEEYCDALAQPEQEPVAWMDVDGNVSDNNDHKCFPIPLYTTPPTAQPEQEPVGWQYVVQLLIAAGHVSQQKVDQACEIAKVQPAQRKPLTDVIKSAQRVIESTEIAHRPPMRDLLEVGRMVRVRLHALADLSDALAAHGIKENT